jgi:hypothetical protein
MDLQFLNNRLYVIAEEQSKKIYFNKEREYYETYFKKLTKELCSPENSKYRATDGLDYIGRFRVKELKNIIYYSLWCRTNKMLFLACKDATDVIRSMERWEGTESHFDVVKAFGLKGE